VPIIAAGRRCQPKDRHYQSTALHRCSEDRLDQRACVGQPQHQSHTLSVSHHIGECAHFGGSIPPVLGVIVAIQASTTASLNLTPLAPAVRRPDGPASSAASAWRFPRRGPRAPCRVVGGLPFRSQGIARVEGVRSENEHQPHAKRTDGLFAISLSLFAAQSSNELSQLDSFLRPRTVTIIPIPLTLRRPATSTMHPANPPSSYRRRATPLSTAF
jgi:hypothetical protein